MDLCHVGDVRQWDLTPGDQVVPSGRLHVPRIDLPKDTRETQLHADIEGSPFSRTPGKMTLAEAAEQAESRGRKDSKEPTTSRSSSSDDPKPDPKPEPQPASGKK
jgi:single-stranded DNA-binding protein